MPARLGRALALLWLAGCADPATQLLVTVCSDFEPGEVETIRARVGDADAPEGAARQEQWPGAALAGPFSFGVAGDPGDTVRLEVALLAPGGAVLAERVVETGFLQHQGLPVDLQISRACAGTTCPEGCEGGRCVPTTVAPERWLERPSACGGDAGMPLVCDGDGDGARALACGGTDCDDGDATIGPGATERCDGVDQDCDGDVDERLLGTFYPDEDGDGYGDEARATEACTPASGQIERGGDCADGDPLRRPGAAERCNELDDDCDGDVDEIVGNRFYPDGDGDGVGRSGPVMVLDQCAVPSGHAPVDGDCDDGDPGVYPGATERCDRVDSDCSSGGGAAPEEDADEDGHAPTDASCVGGFPADDCDDAEARVHGGAPELCSGRDEDCDGATDEGADTQCATGTCDRGCRETETLAIGERVGCYAAVDGVYCWGEANERAFGHSHAFGTFGSRRESAPVRIGTERFEQIRVGEVHGCGVTAAGELWCWGDNRYGQLGVGDFEPRTGLVPVAGIAEEVVQVAVLGRATCALTRLGEVYCFGWNDAGQLGLGDLMDRATPTRVALEDIVELRGGAGNACARRYDGALDCWGAAAVGTGGAGGSATPVRVLEGVLRVAMGGRLAERTFDFRDAVTCAELADGWRCWGHTETGAVGSGAAGTVTTPQPLVAIADAAELAPQGHRSCGLAAGSVRCWGASDRALLGRGETGPDEPLGVAVPLTATPSAIACGGTLCCAGDGTTFECWGDPLSAAHGDGLARDGTQAEPLAIEEVPSALAIGAAHACAVTPSGVSCWGRSNVGAGDARARLAPALVVPGGVSVATRFERTCTLDAAGALACWGRGYAGDAAQTASPLAPVPVDQGAMGPAAAVVSSEAVSCALDLDGDAWCWGGSASSGSLPCGGAADCPTPTPVQGGLRFEELAAGRAHVCGRTAGGAVHCWGSRFEGKLGDGMSSGRSEAPVAVVGITDAARLVARENGGCVVHAGGAVSCWGSGDLGGNGDGSTSDRSTPVAVAGLPPVADLECHRSCIARTTDDRYFGWGDNAPMTLGDGTQTRRAAPVAAAHGLSFDAVAVGQSMACGLRGGAPPLCWGAVGTPATDALGYAIRSELTLP